MSETGTAPAASNADFPTQGTNHFRFYFGDEHSATPQQMKRRRMLTGGLLLPLFMMFVLPLAYIGLFHSPGPNGVHIDVVGNSAAAMQFVQSSDALNNDDFVVDRVATVDEGTERLLDLDTRAVYDPTTSTLYTAQAGNTQSTIAAERFVTALAASTNTTVNVENLVPLPESDAVGAGVMYVGLGAILAGFLTTAVASLVAPGVRIRWKVLLLGVMSSIAAGIQVLISYGITGTLHDNIGGVAGMVFLLAFTCGIVTLGGFVNFGPVMMLISLGLYIMLGVPASGVAVGLDLAPSFYQFLHPLLPTSTALDGLKRIAYFDGSGLGPVLLTMAVWAAIGCAGVVIGHRRRVKAVTLEPTVAAVEVTDPGSISESV